MCIRDRATPVLTRMDFDGLEAQITASLKSLRMDSLDVFYLHGPDPLRVPTIDTLKACDKLKRQGLFRELGLSAFPAWEVAHIHHLCDAHGLDVKPTIYQGIMNAVSREMDAELLPVVRTYGMRCVVYNPLGAGVLAGRYKSEAELQQQTTGRFSPEFEFASPKAPPSPFKGTAHKMYRKRYSVAPMFEAVERIRTATSEAGLVMSEATLRWTLHHSCLRPDLGDGLIFGTSSVAQTRQNLAACRGAPLTDFPNVLRAYDEAWDHLVPHAEELGYFRGYDAKQGSAKGYLAKF